MQIRRFIERDYLCKRIKDSSELLQDEDIEKILDEHEWCDLTFYFDEKPSGYIQTIITDNRTSCDVALIDLNINAQQFYLNHINEMKRKHSIEQIRQTLYGQVV